MNDLRFEKSPYLLQHRNNPVLWQAWNERTFARAREENKPIFLSIGYSTCHWCHVMARESFENPEIAEILNKHFIAIKVDREERPDVDAIYMSALLSLTGSGGWPLSAWLTPDARPFFAGTYFPRAQFAGLLNRIAELWQNEHGRLIEDAGKFTEALRTNLLPPAESLSVSTSQLVEFDSQFENRFDEDFGGFRGGPKFPQNMSLQALMRNDLLNGPTRTREFVASSLTGMISAGLFDHLEGGFHRYSVDQEWAVPHFEKMLYDQAWITVVLLEASQFLHDSRFLVAAEQTLQFVCEQLTHSDGGFFSALDAESVNPETGVKSEGFYYTFSPNELQGAEEFLKTCPKVDGRIVLQRPPDDVKIDWQRLLQIRSRHPRPSRDEKIVTAWNGWMIAAFCKGFDQTGNERWLKTAEKAWTFTVENLRNGKTLARRWAQGDTSIPATSEDYAALIYAALSLYHSSLNPKYLDAAVLLQTEMNEKFLDRDKSGYLLSSEHDSNLLFRFQQDGDLVTPSTNSLAAHNLVRLGLLTDRAEFIEQADLILQNLGARFVRSPLNWSYFVVAASARAETRKVLVENPGAEMRKLRELLRKSYQPFLLLAVSSESGSNREGFLVCTEDRCLPAVYTASEVMRLVWG